MTLTMLFCLLQSTEMASPEFAPAVAALLRRFHAIPAPVGGCQHGPYVREVEYMHVLD
jgi:hypothetical protein